MSPKLATVEVAVGQDSDSMRELRRAGCWRASRCRRCH